MKLVIQGLLVRVLPWHWYTWATHPPSDKMGTWYMDMVDLPRLGIYWQQGVYTIMYSGDVLECAVQPGAKIMGADLVCIKTI